VEADWCIGELVTELKRLGLMENTLIIFSSDNGPVLNDGYYDDAVELNGTHTPWGPYRGGKYSLFEAGTRVPFFTYWKGTIAPGTSKALITQIDIFSSLASLTGSDLRGPDSRNLIETMLGRSQMGRENFVHEAIGRSSLRSGSWKYIPAQVGPAVIKNVNIETGSAPDPQLYDLSSDPGEQKNLAMERPEMRDSLEYMYNRLRFE
jgi:arylsulfatase A-like enzyme